MPRRLALEDMTLHEKLAAMEMLWDDLTRMPENIPSPAWHEEILGERRRQIETGAEPFKDWETAKAELRTRTA